MKEGRLDKRELEQVGRMKNCFLPTLTLRGQAPEVLMVALVLFPVDWILESWDRVSVSLPLGLLWTFLLSACDENTSTLSELCFAAS